eukprot:NODE_164_length_16443_cov_0.166544.p12 type:complete len:107 gc:universal NODE_164_length_16443_cov_0.166544:3458-3138(-)
MLDVETGTQMEYILKSRIKEHRRVSALDQKPQLEAIKISKLNGGDILDLDDTSSVESTTSNNVSQMLSGYLFKSKSKSQENKKEDMVSRSQSFTSNSRTSTLNAKK